MKAHTLASLDSIVRHFIVSNFPHKAVEIYSKGRKKFLEKLDHEGYELNAYVPPKDFGRNLWGLYFRSPIMNAAGMFKNAEGYHACFNQGAGAYIGGTGTFNQRSGNVEKDAEGKPVEGGVVHPFVPYPLSGAASNALGLPNDGDDSNVERAFALCIIKKKHMPVGWNVARSPDYPEEEGLKLLVKSMKEYEKAGVDFIEINESCPNTGHDNIASLQDFRRRLHYIKVNFLDQRRRKLPVKVKLSNDTSPEQIPSIMDVLFEEGYDGVNFGNTSILYDKMRMRIHPQEQMAFDYFTKKFKGGVSGRPLKEKSLELCSLAVDYRNLGAPNQEFHVFRTGGIETLADIKQSENAGVSMNQWFTGYFEAFAKDGHDVYKTMFVPKTF
jgi:dihydroorotate dehydrogenase